MRSYDQSLTRTDVENGVRVGPYRLDTAQRRLYKEEQPHPCQPQVFELLIFLAMRHPDAVSNQEICRTFWGREPADAEENLKNLSRRLYQTLEDQDRDHPKYVDRGGGFFRLVCEVRSYSDGVQIADLTNGQGTHFYSCFISYSTKDQVFAERLHADLQSKGVQCWFAPHSIRSGKKLHEQIDEAIRVYDRLLLILSDHSMTSEWVKTEISHARQKELHEKRQVLFPVSLVPFSKIREWKCFDADTGKDSAREIREYFIPDFSEWKNHHSYQQALQRLLRDFHVGNGSAENESLPITRWQRFLRRFTQ